MKQLFIKVDNVFNTLANALWLLIKATMVVVILYLGIQLNQWYQKEIIKEAITEMKNGK